MLFSYCELIVIVDKMIINLLYFYYKFRYVDGE